MAGIGSRLFDRSETADSVHVLDPDFDEVPTHSDMLDIGFDEYELESKYGESWRLHLIPHQATHGAYLEF